MKNVLKRGYSFAYVLSFIMLFSCLCLSAAAADFSMSGSGTEADPYLVSSAEHLEEIALASETDTLDNVYFLQTADISVNSDDAFIADIGFSLSQNPDLEVFPCIGPDAAHPFKGTYDGGGFAIKNAVLAPNGLCSGLFGYVDSARINNVTLENTVLTMNTYAGAIAANADGKTEITECSFAGVFADSGKTSFLGVQMGGIVGYADQESIVSGCSVYADTSVSVSPFVLSAGGIAGTNAGVIEECVNYLSIGFNTDNYLASFGGIAGHNTGKIAGCRNDGDIYGELMNRVSVMYAGGIAGENSGIIERCINTASVSTVGFGEYPCYAGGIAGYNHSGAISVCSNTGGIYSDITYAGGIAGINFADTKAASLDNCFNSGFILGSANASGGLVGGNIAVNGYDNVASVKSCLSAGQSQTACFGEVSAQGTGRVEIENVYIQDVSDDYANTLTESELVNADRIDGLNSDAWVYPKDGFVPGLAVVRNLEKLEVLAVNIDKAAEKLAYSVYNPSYSGDAVAVIAFYSSGRLKGVEFQNIELLNGYSVYTAASELVSSSDEVKIIAVESLDSVSPVAQSAEF